jgi:hypothetical protein
MFAIRLCSVSAVLALASCAGLTARATEVVQGRVVTAGNHSITIERENRARLMFHLAANASVTKNGHPAKLEELTSADRATITTDNRLRAILVVARSTSTPASPAGRAPAVARLAGWVPTGATIDLRR